MALTEYYVDSSIGTNTGSGTVGDPWGNLGYAFTQGTAPGSSSDGVRYNLKTNPGNPETNYGSLPTGGSDGKQVVVQSYNSTAGDTTDYAYINFASTGDWTNTTVDDINFVNLYFTADNATGTQVMYEVDNVNAHINCVFDAARPRGGTSNSFYGTKFINLVATSGVMIGNANAHFHNCNFSGSGSISNTTIAQGLSFVGNTSYWDGAIATHFASPANSGCIINNSVAYASPSTTTTGFGLRADNFVIVRGNYVQRARHGIGWENNADTPMILDNAFFGCTNNIWTNAQESITLPFSTQTTLAAAGISDPANGDYTPTDELYELRTSNLFNGGVTPTVSPQFYGAFLSPNTGSGGGSYVHIPKIRTIQ